MKKSELRKIIREEIEKISFSLPQKALKFLKLRHWIDTDNQFTSEEQEELLEYFELVEEHSGNLQGLINKIKSGEVTVNDIISDWVDSFGGDYNGVFNDYEDLTSNL